MEVLAWRETPGSPFCIWSIGPPTSSPSLLALQKGTAPQPWRLRYGRVYPPPFCPCGKELTATSVAFLVTEPNLPGSCPAGWPGSKFKQAATWLLPWNIQIAKWKQWVISVTEWREAYQNQWLPCKFNVYIFLQKDVEHYHCALQLLSPCFFS